MNWIALKKRLDAYERLMRLDRPIGIFLLLWPTLWGLWLSSQGRPSWVVVWVFVMGTVLMRSAGCAINDCADLNFDRHVERTKNRPLVIGEIRLCEAIIIFAVLALCSFVLVALLGNRLLLWLSLPALLLAITYPFAKRFFAIPQAHLGVAFGFGIPMAYAAHTGTIPIEAWGLLLANVFWAIAYDTEYAMVDREDDLKIGIKTSAITFGRFDVLLVMLCHALTLALLGWMGWRLQRGWGFYGGLTLAGGMMAWHYFLIRGRERAACFRAFLNNNCIGLVIFIGIALDYGLSSQGWL